jgi:hypothetical protein
MDKKIIDLYDEYIHESLDRREFLKKLAILAGSTSVLLLILNTCRPDHHQITEEEMYYISYYPWIKDWQEREGACWKPEEEEGNTVYIYPRLLAKVRYERLHLIDYESDVDGPYWKTSCKTREDGCGDCEDQSGDLHRAIIERRAAPPSRTNMTVVKSVNSKGEVSNHVWTEVHHKPDDFLILDNGHVLRIIFEWSQVSDDIEIRGVMRKVDEGRIVPWDEIVRLAKNRDIKVKRMVCYTLDQIWMASKPRPVAEPAPSGTEQHEREY